jgi:hypothetical protein
MLLSPPPQKKNGNDCKQASLFYKATTKHACLRAARAGNNNLDFFIKNKPIFPKKRKTIQATYCAFL